MAQECLGGLKPVLWADDSDTGGTTLRSGTITCDVNGPDVRVDGSVTAAANQKIGKKVAVKIRVAATEDVFTEVEGKIKVKGASATLNYTNLTVSAGSAVPLTLRPAKPKQAKAVSRALKQGRTATATVTVTLTDQAENIATRKVKVKLKR